MTCKHTGNATITSVLTQPLSRTVYQAQFQGESEYGPKGSGQPKGDSTLPDSSSSTSLPSRPTSDETAHEASEQRETSKTDPDHNKEPPLDKHVFQTIFLDKDGSEQKWSRNEVSKDKVILEKWWKQQVSLPHSPHLSRRAR